MLKLLQLGALCFLATTAVASAADADQQVFTALSIPAVPVPSAYPKRIWLKSVGGLACTQTIVSNGALRVASAVQYACTFDSTLASNPHEIYKVLNVPAIPAPSHYGEARLLKDVGRLYCSRTIDVNTTSIGGVSLTFACSLN